MCIRDRAKYASSHLVFLLQSLNDVILNLRILGVLFIQHLPSQHIISGQYWSHAGYLGPVFLILVQQQHKTGRPMFGSMLAGQSFASIPDLGPAVAKDWRPVYRFMLAGRSFASIPDLGPTVAQDWRPMY